MYNSVGFSIVTELGHHHYHLFQNIPIIPKRNSVLMWSLPILCSSGPLTATNLLSASIDLPTLISVQSLSHIRLFATPWITTHQASLSITNSQSLLKLMPIESVMPSSHLIFCHPLLLPPIPPSIRVFSSESALSIRWPKYWSFSFSISPSSEYPGLISFRMDWMGGSPCSPKDSQESSPTPQFKSINSLAVSFLHSPTLTSIHDHWKNNRLD